MSSPATSPAPGFRLLLLGLEANLACGIRTALPECDAWVETALPSGETTCIERLKTLKADVVLCPPGYSQLSLLVQHAQRCRYSVVVVDRDPSMPRWIDALDAGAADYTAPPFESGPLRQILRRLRATAI
ncbi:MAG TPA: hypothetical protein VM120_29150 [Bryobacteraceae bacterium]|nr:hypothetical protein [Bryobacteraceae bacterium]